MVKWVPGTKKVVKYKMKSQTTVITNCKYPQNHETHNILGVHVPITVYICFTIPWYLSGGHYHHNPPCTNVWGLDVSMAWGCSTNVMQTGRGCNCCQHFWSFGFLGIRSKVSGIKSTEEVGYQEVIPIQATHAARLKVDVCVCSTRKLIHEWNPGLQRGV
jgi:hypothetical protein